MKQVSRSYITPCDRGVESALAGVPGAAKCVIGIVRELRVEPVQDGAEDTRERLAHEEGEAAAERRKQVAMRVRDPVDEAFEAEAAEIVRHAGGRVGLRARVVERGDTRAQGTVGEAGRGEAEGAQGGEERHGSWLPPAESRS